MCSLISFECVAFRIESRSELKMDHSLVIFDSSDEMIFSPESTATNSNIHFRIHRSSAVTPEEHYNILNDLFGTPAYSPDTDEDKDTLTSGISLSTPKRILPEFSKDSEMEVRNVFQTIFSDQLTPVEQFRNFRLYKL